MDKLNPEDKKAPQTLQASAREWDRYTEAAGGPGKRSEWLRAAAEEKIERER